MPNWCTTDYAFSGSADNAKGFYNDIKRVINTDRSYVWDGKTFKGDASWLGYIKEELLPELKEEEIPCRGSIEYLDELDIIDNNEATVKFTTETAWCACYELMEKLAEKYELLLYYYTEEPGCCIYETNDEEGIFFSQRYLIDSEKFGSDYYDDFDGVAKTLEEITGCKISCIEDAKPILEKYNEDSFLTINEITVV